MSGDGSSQSETLDRKIGSYRLLQPLGVGGMSSVFRAVHEETGLEVAVKVLPRAFAKNSTTVQRFLREAKSAESLEHPGIVAIYDHGIDKGRHYLVLEYVAGGDLHDLIREHGPMGVPEALMVIRSVAESLKYASSQGLIHRDIKPANILLTHDRKVKLADLGLALRDQDEDERVTREGTTVGTVDYMAPEQARDSRGTSIRSDMYSLGSTLYFLLTGQPPYPGGDIVDKLARHCNAPIPDPSDFRGDLPVGLLSLAAKLMAKRPEQRFESYDALIAAIDAIPVPAQSRSLGSTLLQSPSPLFALMDDEDGNLSLHKSLVESPAPKPKPMLVDSGLIPLDALSLVELDDIEESPPKPRVEPSTPPVAPAALPRIASLAELELEVEHEADSEHVEASGPAVLPSLKPKAGEVPSQSDGSRNFILTCVLVGLSIILVVIGLDQLFRENTGVKEDLIIEALEGISNEDDSASAALEKSVVHAPAVVKPREFTGPPKPETPTPSPTAVWVEPPDPEPPVVKELEFDAADEARVIPDWARASIPITPSGKRVVLQRVNDPRHIDLKTTLKSALEATAAETIEIQDNGPFFESDFRFVGDRRCIRAIEGFRPMIVIEPGRGNLAPGQSAYLDLGEKELVLEGLDLVVDVSSLSSSIVALFSVRGGSLILRDCTLTVLNPSNRPFSLVKTGPSGRASQFLLERSIIRGSCTTVVDVGSGPVEATISRSLVFNRAGSMITDSGQGDGPPDRVIAFVRSILATGHSTIVRTSTNLEKKRRKRLAVRSLGSTFAHFQSLQPIPFCEALSTAQAQEVLDWKGEANEFLGWARWFDSTGKEPTTLESLGDARRVWPADELTSLENRIPWPIPPAAERIAPAQLRDFAVNRLSTLEKLPVPSATLIEQTVGAFERPLEPIPRTRPASPSNAVASIAPRGTPPPQPGASNSLPPSERSPDLPALGALPGKVVRSADAWRELEFKTDEPGQNGDLGLFLAARIHPDDKAVRVRARGFGNHPFTPYHGPDGIALEIVVEPGADGSVPSWTVSTATSANAALEVRGGSLTLRGLRLARDGSCLARSMLRVESGHLIIDRCRLTEIAKSTKPEGALIDFAATGSKPLQPSAVANSSPFETFIDRPVCRISESVFKGLGDVLSAELGRGLITVRQSVLIAGENVFDLNLSKVARSRVEADLLLDHCTLAAEQSFVDLGPWPGSKPGPDRPLLVTSLACVYLANFDKASRESAVLRADPSGIASGAIFWQSNSDVFDVTNFTALEGVRPNTTSNVAKRLHVRWDWIEFWGQNHSRNIAGPRGGVAPSTILFAKLRPGDVEPGDLYLNLPGRNAVDLGANLAKLGIAPSPVVGRRR